MTISFHFLQTCTISVQNFTHSLMVILLFVAYYFLLLLSKFFAFDLLQFDYSKSWHGFLWFLLFETFWALCIWIPISFLRFGKYLAIISLNEFSGTFSSHSGTSITCILVFLLVFYKPFIFFSLFQSVPLCLGVQWSFFSACSSLMPFVDYPLSLGHAQIWRWEEQKP